MKGWDKPKLNVLFDLLTLLCSGKKKKKEKKKTFDMSGTSLLSLLQCHALLLFFEEDCISFWFLLLSAVLFFSHVNESKGASFSYMPIAKKVLEESRGVVVPS